MNEPALRNELAKPEYTVKTDAERLADLQLKNIPSKVSIPVQNIKQYMMVASNTWIPIKNSTSTSASKAMDALSEFPSFDITNPLVETTLISLLDGLIADVPEFTAAHKEAILAMGDTLTSKEELLGFVGVTLGDVMRARV